eukprot:s1_g939.t1
MQLAHRALFRAADQRLQESLGITAVQQGALFVIGKQEPCKPSAIAKALDMNKSAVTTLVARLEAADFIHRGADEKDGRAQRITLTPKGKDAIRKSVPLTKQANADLLDGFEPHEVETIERFLTQVISTSARAASQTRAGPPPTSVEGEMYAALADNVVAAQSDPDVRAILITGTGDSYSAGNDMGDFAGGGDSPRGENELPPVGQFLQAILNAEKPIVAAVNGMAIGVGVTMLLHCDLVYASPNATFQTPFVNLGLVPEAASSLLLPKLIGTQKANDMFLLGTKVTAEEAEKMGLVCSIFDEDSLQEEALTRARALAAKAPNAVKLTKQLVRQDHADVAQQMADESVHFSAQLKTAEFAEAAMAFAERRAPDFSKI